MTTIIHRKPKIINNIKPSTCQTTITSDTCNKSKSYNNNNKSHSSLPRRMVNLVKQRGLISASSGQGCGECNFAAPSEPHPATSYTGHPGKIALGATFSVPAGIYVSRRVTRKRYHKITFTRPSMKIAASTLTAAFILTSNLGVGNGIVSATSSQGITFTVESETNLSVTVWDSNVETQISTSSIDINTDTNNGFNSESIKVVGSTTYDNGYTLSMNANDRNGGTSLVRTIAYTSGEHAGEYPSIPTLTYNGTTGYTEETFETNAWGYQINNSGRYLSVTPTNTIDDTDENGSKTTTVTLAAKLDNAKPSGSYQTTLTFYAVANYIPASNQAGNTIRYNSIVASDAGTMGDQTIPMTGDTYNSTVLFASNFSRRGYGFAGWMSTETPEEGTLYFGPHQTITDAQIKAIATSQNGEGSMATNGIVLYANWVPSSGTLQGWNGCSNLTAVDYDTTTGAITATNAGDHPSVTALTDTRDGNTYAVARLADGQCWMVESLRLSNTTLDGDPVTINNTNTNNPYPGISDENNTIAAFTLPSPTNGAWCTGQNAACYDQALLETTNILQTSQMTGNNGSVYAYGTYYNWSSATGGWGAYGTTYYLDSEGTLIGTKVGDADVVGTSENAASTITTSTSDTTMPGDICPAGWHLPIGNTTGSGNAGVAGSFSDLDKHMGGTGQYQQSNPTQVAKWRTYPNNFLYSGVRVGWSINYRSEHGPYWSSTAGSNVNAYYLTFYGNDIYPGTYSNHKYNGFTVRCVAGS